MTKNKKPEYQVLSDIEHVRLRTGMYAGSINEQTKKEWIYDFESQKMKEEEITYIPALIKCYSEILDNAIDESRRHPDTDTIKIQINDDGSIIIQDNGHGIPIEIHEQTGKYNPETIFTNLKAGSNFNDSEDQQLVGTHGIGSTICLILSTSFKIETCDGKKAYSQLVENGMTNIHSPKIRDGNKTGTKLTFTLDYDFFKQIGLTEGNKQKMIKKVVDAAACNPTVKFYINGEKIAIKDFDGYISLYTDDYVSDITDDWKIGISASDGFDQISFVNSVETFEGGTHVDYVSSQIVEKIRIFINKKHKVDVKPSEIKNHIRVFISANINRPKFSSQSKENLVSAIKDYKTSWIVPDKMVTKILKSSIIQSILDWVEAKKLQEENKKAKELGKEIDKLNPKRVEKFDDASEKINRHKCILLLGEGDSAVKALLGGRGKNPYIGIFPLRGKVLNVRGLKTKAVMENKEIKNILTIMGLKVGEPVEIIDAPAGKWYEVTGENIFIINENDSLLVNGKWVTIEDIEYSKKQINTLTSTQEINYKNNKKIKRQQIPNLRFGKIGASCDQDLDGKSIIGLLLNLCEQYWPELFSVGGFNLFQTPLVRVSFKGKQSLDFFTEREFHVWEEKEGKKIKGWTRKYYKGLGTFTSKEMNFYLDNINDYLYQIELENEEDNEALDLAFNDSRADDRKVWLETPSLNFEELIS
jgi:DNA topoisomerase-2